MKQGDIDEVFSIISCIKAKYSRAQKSNLREKSPDRESVERRFWEGRGCRNVEG